MNGFVKCDELTDRGTVSALYEDNWDYLSEALNYLDLLIYREVLSRQQTSPENLQEILKGAYISEAEVERLLSGKAEARSIEMHTEVEESEQKATALLARIEERRKASLEGSVYLALPHLAHLFALTPFEEMIVLICLAPELDLKYERLYAYLHDDMTRRKPSVDLVMRLLCTSSRERIQARAFFSHQAPLFHPRLLRFAGNGDNPLAGRSLKLDDRVVNFILGIDSGNQELDTYTQLVTSHPNLGSLRWSDELKRQLVNLLQSCIHDVDESQRRLIYHFYGSKGTGKKTLAAGLCAEIGIPLLVVDLQKVLRGGQSFKDIMHPIFREGILRPAAIYLEHVDYLLENENQATSYLQEVADCIDEFSWLTFIATEKYWAPAGLFGEHIYVGIELPMPDMMARNQLWGELSANNGVLSEEVDFNELAVKFRLTPGQMEAALVAASNRANFRAGEDKTIQIDDLYFGGRAQSNQKLGSLSRKLSPHYTWKDITLPQNALDQLGEICAQVRHRQTVYETWGFDKKLSLGKGLCALFYGPSGTGKTMAAEVITNELHLEAYKVDLSCIVSKYIGETEKNLAKIFQEAETSNAILFFDEADALFGKRSEVKDAHDRYANIELSYLLQRMEEFEGLVILATNLRKNIDEAFFRRMQFAVEFPFPEAKYRYRIWKGHIPADAPVAEGIDFNFLANRFNITGGNIKNIIVNAAFLAAEASSPICMQHMIHATQREYEKIGRGCTSDEFSPYQDLLRVS
ncbi:MAG: ATP-binding protein [Phycisphaerae bacterium]|nr:ATP-binding protein [Phycisphaerae bacterium]